VLIEERAHIFYQQFLGLRLHFDPSSDYDYERYGRVRVSLETFRQKTSAYKLATSAAQRVRPPEYFGFIVANLVNGLNGSPTEMAWLDALDTRSAEVTFYAWKSRIGSLPRHFEDGIKRIARYEPDVSKWISKGRNFPIIGEFALTGMIVPEVYVVLCDVFDVWDELAEFPDESGVWRPWHSRMRSYCRLAKFKPGPFAHKMRVLLSAELI